MQKKLAFVVLCALLLSGCRLQRVNRLTNEVTNGTAFTPTPLAPLTVSPSSLLTITPVPVVTAAPVTMTPTATQISATVTVSSVNGNLFIRRGPDLAFNPIGALLDGQNETAMARDPLAKWLQIPIPGQEGRTGWISIQTSYSAVSGDIMSLPELAPTDWPVLAFIENCTYNQMEIDPGAIVLPSFANFPDNRIQINPGAYSIHDTSVAGDPEVLNVEIREGSQVDVTVDGSGGKRKCPKP